MRAVSPNDVARMLTRFKGPRGLCARLNELYAELDNLNDSPARFGGMTVGGSSHTNSISDSTFRDSVALMTKTEKIDGYIYTLERTVGCVGSCLSRMKHGDVVADYYLDESGKVSWRSLAIECKVTHRTTMLWRDKCIHAMAEDPSPWLAQCEWLLN